MKRKQRTVFAVANAGFAMSISICDAGQHSGVVTLGKGPGSFGTCALLADHHVSCWGSFYRGGDPSIAPADVANVTTAVEVAQGEGFGCARLANQTVSCWGGNAYGNLGDGTATPRVGGALVMRGVNPLPGITSISVGSFHVCATSFDTTVWCWGFNGDGQIGNYGVTAAQEPHPAKVYVFDGSGNPPLSNVAYISAGRLHTCSLLADGTAETGNCWGYGELGQLGNGISIISQNSPTRIAISGDPTDFRMIPASLSAGGNHTCALVPEGTTTSVACWGENTVGQLGNTSGTTLSGATIYNPSPSATEFSDGGKLKGVTAVTTGHEFSCALLLDGTVACWGRNQLAQLGNPSFTTDHTTSPLPVYAADGSKLGSTVAIVQIVGGSTHVCARNANGDVFCWGDNSGGQMGGALASSVLKTYVPVRVPLDPPIFFDGLESD